MLKVPLPCWPHCNDHLTVWRRAHTCEVRIASDAQGATASGVDQSDADVDAVGEIDALRVATRASSESLGEKAGLCDDETASSEDDDVQEIVCDAHMYRMHVNGEAVGCFERLLAG